MRRGQLGVQRMRIASEGIENNDDKLIETIKYRSLFFLLCFVLCIA